MFKSKSRHNPSLGELTTSLILVACINWYIMIISSSENQYDYY